MHQETFYYMYQQLDKKYKVKPNWVPPYKPSGPGVKVRSKRVINIPSGDVRMGADRDEIEFGWDNEFPLHVANVPAFGIDDLNITNGEYLEFVQSGEYENASHWRPQDWEWKNKFGLKHPVFWGKKDSGEYVVKCLFGEEIALNDALAWPVFVSWAEATAYAHWKGRSLPTEHQWQRAAYSTPDGASRKYPWGDSKPTEEHGNFNWVNYAPTPSGSHPKSASAWGVEDLIGDAWEWTCTPFGPFPGFQAMENYPGYSTDFFDEKHFVMKGASWATHEKIVRPSFRNWYQDRYPYHFGKFRLVSN
jgi:gamma-glutamyl hercynylcysteine S-oxide synthase